MGSLEKISARDGECFLLSALTFVGFYENQENREVDMLRNPILTPMEADQSERGDGQRRNDWRTLVPPVDFSQLIRNSHISSQRGTGEQYWMPDAFDAMMEDIHTLKTYVKLYLNSCRRTYNHIHQTNV